MRVVTNGAVLNGNQVDGVTYILHRLGERFGQLGEEQRLKAMRDFMDFDRKPYETIDELLTRFEVLRNRSREVADFEMNFEGISFMLLRSCRVSDQQFIMLTQPTNGRLPNDELQYRNLFAALRRLGHVVENFHDNIAQGIRNPQAKGRGKGDRAGTYLGNALQDSQSGYTDESAYPQWNLGDDSWTDNTWHDNRGWHDDQSSHSDPWVGHANTATDSNTGWNLGTWTEPVYNTHEPADSGTDTDTASSVGEAWYEYEDIEDFENLGEPQQAEELFWAYQRAKGRYRRFMRKPVRRVRRFLKRRGKGKGKHPGYYLANLSEQEIESMFFAKGRKGKGKGKRSSGKGKGRRQNPKGPDGQIMKCRKCGSTEHFQRECPRNSGGGHGKGGKGNKGPPALGSSFFVGDQAAERQNAPLSTLGPRIVETLMDCVPSAVVSVEKEIIVLTCETPGAFVPPY
jgi:hypothetical protein